MLRPMMLPPMMLPDLEPGLTLVYKLFLSPNMKGRDTMHNLPDGTYLWDGRSSKFLPLAPTTGYWVATGSISFEVLLGLTSAIVGVWTDPDTFLRHYDVAIWVEDVEIAKDYGRAFKQKAIWDIAAGTEIKL